VADLNPSSQNDNKQKDANKNTGTVCNLIHQTHPLMPEKCRGENEKRIDERQWLFDCPLDEILDKAESGARTCRFIPSESIKSVITIVVAYVILFARYLGL